MPGPCGLQKAQYLRKASALLSESQSAKLHRRLLPSNVRGADDPFGTHRQALADGGCSSSSSEPIWDPWRGPWWGTDLSRAVLSRFTESLQAVQKLLRQCAVSSIQATQLSYLSTHFIAYHSP